MAKLTEEEEEYLKNYESRYGEDLAHKLRKILENQIEEEQKRENLVIQKRIEESKIQDEDERTLRIPDHFGDPEQIKALFACVIEMVLQVQNLEIDHGFCYIIKREGENQFSIRAESEVADNPLDPSENDNEETLDPSEDLDPSEIVDNPEEKDGE